MMRACLFIACALAPVRFAVATVVTLDMSTLPSAQGWTYTAVGPSHGGQLETNIWATSGTVLSMNTMPSALVSPSGNYYIQTNLVNAIDDIILSWRSRVLESEFIASSHYGWALNFETGSQGINVGFETNGIVLGTGSLLAFDATGFHDYRVEFTPGESSFDLFIDNSLFASGSASVSALNRILFGDGSGASNARAEMTSYSFVQVPEPRMAAVVLCVAPILLIHRWRNRRRRSA